MANPNIVTCTASTWTAVATNVTSATLHLITGRFVDVGSANVWIHTYRLTGGAAPTDETDAYPFEEDSAKYTHSAPIDIYVKSKNVTGTVRVDA